MCCLIMVVSGLLFVGYWGVWFVCFVLLFVVSCSLFVVIRLRRRWLVVLRCSLFVVRCGCWLFVVCCMLLMLFDLCCHVLCVVNGCCLLFVVCCFFVYWGLMVGGCGCALFVVRFRCALFVGRCSLLVVCCLMCVVRCCLWFVIRLLLCCWLPPVVV